MIKLYSKINGGLDPYLVKISGVTDSKPILKGTCQ